MKLASELLYDLFLLLFLTEMNVNQQEPSLTECRNQNDLSFPFWFFGCQIEIRYVEVMSAMVDVEFG